MHFTSCARRAVAALSALSVLSVGALWSNAASAAVVTLNNAAVTRDLPLPGRNLFNWVNFNDCEQNLHLTFPLVLDPDAIANSSYSLVVYAGAAGATCTDIATRNAPGTSTQTCWKVTGSPVTRSQTLNLSLPLRDIISQYGGSAKGDYAGPYGESVCHELTSSGPTSITVWFFLIDGSGALQGTPAQFVVSADLVGPAPPTSVSAGIADTALILNWTPSGDTDTAAYNVYCDPPAAGAAAPDAAPVTTTSVDAGFTEVCIDGGFDGAVDDAGLIVDGGFVDGGCSFVANPSGGGSSSSGGTTGATTCPSTVLVPAQGTTTSTNEAGVTVTAGSQFINSAYLCGSAGSVSSSNATVSNLVDGTYYTVAVAGIDNYGNSGILSTPACSTPQQVTDFWQEYRAAGGLAGGGFCSVPGIGVPATATPLVVFGGWAVVTVIRRRRKKK